MAQYSPIITNLGKDLIADSIVNGTLITLKYLAWGDGGGISVSTLETQTSLINEVYRKQVSSVEINHEVSYWIDVVTDIPNSVGGFYVREVGIFTEDNILFAVASHPEFLKSLAVDGTAMDFREKLILEVTNLTEVNLYINPSVVMATIDYVNNVNLNHKHTGVSPQPTKVLLTGGAEVQGVLPSNMLGIVEDLNINSHKLINVSEGVGATDGVNVSQLGVALSQINNYPYKTYCANSGNVNVDGYPDIITKVSDTEVSFKVGFPYANLEITFPSGKHYVISSITNVTGLVADGVYNFVIYETNLFLDTVLNDGTYTVTATAVTINYSEQVVTPLMASNSEQGFQCWMENMYNPGIPLDVPTAYYLMDGNTGTTVTFTEGDQGSSYRFIIKSLNGAVALTKVQVDGPGHFGLGGNASVAIYGSNNGTTWTLITSVSSTATTDVPNSTAYTYYGFHPDIDLIGGYSQWDTWLQNINFWYLVTYSGGNITEGYTYPASGIADGDLNLLINQNPMKPQLRTGGIWTDKQFVKIGEVTKLSSLGTPISYAFNGEYLYKRTNLPAVNTFTPFLCNIGSDYIGFFEAVNKSADIGYSVGQKAKIYAYTTNYALDPAIFISKNELQYGSGNSDGGGGGGCMHALVTNDEVYPVIYKWDLLVTAKRSF